MPRWRIWTALILIVLLSWVENQYISESAKDFLAENTRKALHIVFYLSVMLVGYFGWYHHPIKWLRVLWVFSYSFIIIALLGVGFIDSRFHFFSMGFLDQIHGIRVFFISPVPFLILLVLSNMKSLAANN